MAQADFTRIATNIGALNSLQSLRNINKSLALHQERLSTGKAINSAEDNPAGLTIATKMNARSEGLGVAIGNISDAKNMMSVAESGLGEMTDILTEMRSLAEQAASDTLGASERAAIQTELSSYAAQIDDIVSETKWNGVKLLDGTIDKIFQTGADAGETTEWELSTEHSADALNVATKYASAGVANEVASTSLTGASSQSVFSGMSAMSTGSYSFEVLDKAAAAGVGKVNLDGAMLSGVGAVAAVAPTDANSELASGSYTIEIDDVTDATHVSYTIRDEDGNVLDDVNNVDISATGNLVDEAGKAIGVKLTSGDFNTLSAGEDMTFEYIAGGQAKVELNDASDQAVSIDKDGVAGGNSATYAYVDAGASYNSGRGVNVSVAAIGDVTTGEEIKFDYHPSGDYVVDVSTASKASNYMTTVDTALDTVSASLADLGSLMARLTLKEESVSVSQVNVEASYNRIMNADMAAEQLEATKLQILQQTATTMLATANTAPQAILSLFQ